MALMQPRMQAVDGRVRATRTGHVLKTKWENELLGLEPTTPVR